MQYLLYPQVFQTCNFPIQFVLYIPTSASLLNPVGSLQDFLNNYTDMKGRKMQDIISITR